MIKFSKTTLLSILLAVFVITAGVCVYQWWQTKGELEKQTERNENLMKQINELQKEIEELKTAQIIEDGTIKDKKLELTIITNKIEYKQGEEVKISVDYDENLYVWDLPSFYWFIQRKINNSWIELQEFVPTPCVIECKDVPLNKTVGCVICQLEAPSWHLREGSNVNFTWGQRHLSTEGIYRCYGRNSEIISWKCMNYKQVPPGEYKVRFEYALNIKNAVVREGADIKYVEKEFRIVK